MVARTLVQELRFGMLEFRSFARILVVAVWIASAGCQAELPGAHKGPGHRPQRLHLNPRQELALGREAFHKIQQQLPEVAEGESPRRVSEIGRRIADTVQIEPLRREINLHTRGFFYEWEFKVFRSPDANAFCLPAGKVGVLSGMLRTVENDDQLAAILGHEIAHALAHHTSERLAQEANLGGGILAQLGRLRYDREQESEADHIGVFLMTFAGYDPREAITFWQKMATGSRAGGKIPEMVSSHPSDERRIAQLREWVPMALGAKTAYDQGRIAPR